MSKRKATTVIDLTQPKRSKKTKKTPPIPRFIAGLSYRMILQNSSRAETSYYPTMYERRAGGQGIFGWGFNIQAGKHAGVDYYTIVIASPEIISSIKEVTATCDCNRSHSGKFCKHARLALTELRDPSLPLSHSSSSSSSSSSSDIFIVVSYITGCGEWGDHTVPENTDYEIHGVYTTEEAAQEKAEEVREEEYGEWEESCEGNKWSTFDVEDTIYRGAEKIVEILEKGLDED